MMRLALINLKKKKFYIWSGEHQAYWGPDSAGYWPRDMKEKAGQYTLREALATTWNCGSDKKISFEEVK